MTKTRAGRIPSAALRGVARWLAAGVLGALAWMAACHGPEQRVSPAFDEESVTGWAQRLVEASLDAAETASAEAEQERAQARRELVADYLGRTESTMEAFRTDVPRVDAEASYDVAHSREELDAADAVRSALLAGAPGLACTLHEPLRLSAAYLDAFEVAVAAVENREPQEQTEVFLQRYESLVDAYNQWAEESAHVVVQINGDLEEAMAPSGSAERMAELLRSSWPRTLLGTCDDAAAARLAGRPLSMRVLDTERELARLLTDAAPSAGPCVDAASAMLDAYLACDDAVRAEALAADAEALQNAQKDVLGRVEEFEAARPEVCGVPAEAVTTSAPSGYTAPSSDTPADAPSHSSATPR